MRHYFRTCDKKQAKERLENYIKATEETIEIWEAIRPVIENFSGKKITKRLKTACQEVMPDWTIYYEAPHNGFGSYKLSFWKKTFQDQRVFYLAYQEEELSVDGVIKHNGWITFDKTRLEKYKEAMSRLDEFWSNILSIGVAVDVFESKLRSLECEYIFDERD